MPNIDLPRGTSAKRIVVSGTEIHYLHCPALPAEQPAGAPLLFLHGNTGCCRWWDLVLPVAGHGCYAPDMPNFGLSGRLAGSDISAYADSMLAFIDALDLARPIVVAHSLGGAVALSMAASQPGKLSGLVLVDSSPPNGLVTPEEHYPVIELFKTNRPLLTSALASVMPGNKDVARLELLVDMALLMNPASFAGNARALAVFDVGAGLAGADLPVLVLWGELDAIITRAMAESTVAAFPPGRARLAVLPGIGHSVMIEDPALFSRQLEGFLASI